MSRIKKRKIRLLNRWFDETSYTIDVPITYDGPSKILILADIHDHNIEELLSYVNILNVDAIVIPGDLCNEHIVEGKHYYKGKKKNNSVSKQGLNILSACTQRCLTYYSRGNHEWMFDEDDINAVKSTGAIFVDNEFIQHSEHVFIGAISSPLKYERNGIFPENHAPYVNWVSDFEKCEGFKIMLCHHPEYYPKYLKNTNVDLVISGHAHGGQIRIGNRGLWAPGQGIFPKLTSGIVDGKLLISRGLANTVKYIPRINNRPEIVLLHMCATSNIGILVH